jgi:DNA adenine methylase
MGGKARLRKWLIDFFPKNGNRYFEVFAGLGNVFYAAKKSLEFKEWYLNDVNTYKFLTVLNSIDLEQLPEKVDKNMFNYYKSNKDNDLSILLEGRITFGGKGYAAGFEGEVKESYKNPHIGYSGKNYKLICEEARRLLKDCKICNMDWESINFDLFESNDFLYFDPPYYGTKASYKNINHNKLVAVLNSLKCKWLLSGYDNDLYQKELKYIRKFEKERNSEIKSSNLKCYCGVTETIWMNY